MPKILVIEDADDLREDVVEMLSIEGYEVDGVENGKLGVENAMNHPPDLIVCDIMMPELDGFGVLESLQRYPHTKNIPFIFVTAKTDRIDMRQGMNLGADDYVTKPFKVDELLTSIETRLQRSRDRWELASADMALLRENIMAALPHELRTPLNSIIGFSDMLISEADTIKPDQIRSWAQHINSSANRLHRLTENYLYYARIELMRRSPENFEDILYSQLFDSHMSVEFYALQHAEHYQRGDDIQLNLQPAPVIRMTDSYLRKVVEELVDNALKFSEEGSPVYVSTEIDRDMYKLTVQDQGRGMKPDQVKAVGAYMQFDRWYHEQQGMGLGLIISRTLAEIFGGELSIASVPEEGTTACVKIPILDAS